MKTFYSIRTVKAASEDAAIEAVENDCFDEEHPLCDKVLTKAQLLKALQEKTEDKDSSIEILVFYKTKESDLSLGMRVAYADMYGQYTKTGVITHIDATRRQKLYCVNSGTMAATYTADELKLIKKP